MSGQTVATLAATVRTGVSRDPGLVVVEDGGEYPVMLQVRKSAAICVDVFLTKSQAKILAAALESAVSENKR